MVRAASVRLLVLICWVYVCGFFFIVIVNLPSPVFLQLQYSQYSCNIKTHGILEYTKKEHGHKKESALYSVLCIMVRATGYLNYLMAHTHTARRGVGATPPLVHERLLVRVWIAISKIPVIRKSSDSVLLECGHETAILISTGKPMFFFPTGH